MTRLQDRIASVTGAARGIGFACAQRFAAEGATLVLADREEPDEVAAVAAFLASADASYPTGQTIYPDGGRLALNYTRPDA